MEKQELRERAAAALRGAPSPKHTARTPWSGYATVAQADGGSAAHDTREPSPRLSTEDDPERDHIGLASAAMPLAGMQSCCVRSRFSTRANPRHQPHSQRKRRSGWRRVEHCALRSTYTSTERRHVPPHSATLPHCRLCRGYAILTGTTQCFPQQYLLHQPALVVLAAHASGIMCVCVMRPLTVYLGVCVYRVSCPFK